MAVIEFVNGKNPTLHGLKRAIDYIKNPAKTQDDLIYGHFCDPVSSFENFKMTKKLFNKESGGRQFIHFVQSFEADPNLTPEKVHQIGREFLKRCNLFNEYQVVMATHTNTNILHNHFIINTVNFENGRKWQTSKNDLIDLKELSDHICIENGLSVIEKSNDFIAHDQYRALGEKRSWKQELSLAIRNTMYSSVSTEDFISKMNKLNYSVDWEFMRQPYEVELLGSLITTAKQHSTSETDFLKNMNTYGVQTEWNYICKVSDIETGNDIKEYKFASKVDLNQFMLKIDPLKHKYNWTDDIVYKYNDKLFTPNSFETSYFYSGNVLRDAFNVNRVNGVKDLPDISSIKINKSSQEYRKFYLAAKTVKQYSTTQNDFIEKMKSLGYGVKWDADATERQLLNALVHKAMVSSSTLEDFEKALNSLGVYHKKSDSSYKFALKENELYSELTLTNYDKNYLYSEFTNDTLMFENLTKSLNKRFKDPIAAEKQFKIFTARLSLWIDAGLAEKNDEGYVITEKGKEGLSNLDAFKFTSYDSNVIFDYIHKSEGKLTVESLKELLSEEYSEIEYRGKMLSYILRRIDKNIELGTISKETDSFVISDFGYEKANQIKSEYQDNKIKKKDAKQLIVTKSFEQIKNVFSENPLELQDREQIVDELKKSYKYITFELPSGKKIRNSKMSSSKQFSKESLTETFKLNDMMKMILNSSQNKTVEELVSMANEFGCELSYDEVKKHYNLKYDGLECYFSEENIKGMIPGETLVLPGEEEIFKTLNPDKIMFTTPDGKKCTNAALMPYDLYSKEHLLEVFANNQMYEDQQMLNAQFELLLKAISLFEGSQDNQKQLPLSSLEGMALEEKLKELEKGRGYDFSH